MSFTKELEAFTLKIESNSDKVFRGTLLSLFSKVIKRTPVGNPENWVYFDKSKGMYVDYISARGYPEGYIGGRLRGNWQASLSAPSQGVVADQDKTGAKTIAKVAFVTSQAKMDQDVFLVNNLPYAVPVENGSSTQAPEGMVAVTVAEFQREVDKQARQLK
jgi:hypothetical protein